MSELDEENLTLEEVNKRLVEGIHYAILRSEAAAKRSSDRDRVLYQEYLRRIKEEPEIVKNNEESEVWQNLAESQAQELYIPGCVISWSNNFYVIDSVRESTVYSWKVTPETTKSRQPTNSWSIRFSPTIVDINDITDPKLNRTARKLIGKVRMKDW